VISGPCGTKGENPNTYIALQRICPESVGRGLIQSNYHLLHRTMSEYEQETAVNNFK
jgi:hypothetical protein